MCTGKGGEVSRAHFMENKAAILQLLVKELDKNCFH